MRIVAVTACTTGIAHTYMAAEKLMNAAKAFGFDSKVETHGSLGVENIINQKAIDDADLAIPALPIDIEGMKPFNTSRTINVGVAEAIHSPHQLFSTL